MAFSAFMERHRKSILLLMAALAVAGLFAAMALPVGLFPQVSFPRVRINIDSGDRPASQMALLVTKPVEDNIRAVPGVTSVRSATSRGSAQIFLNFAWGTNMNEATLAADAAIAQLLPSFPVGTTYTVKRMDPTVFPIIAYAMTSKTVSHADLRGLAEYRIIPLLSGVSGVARVGVQGGASPEVHVSIDPHRLAALHLTLADIEQAVAKADVLQAVGHLQDHDLLYLLVQNNRLDDIQAVKNIVVHAGIDGVVRLADIATVTNGVVPRYFEVAEDGKPAVTFQVYQQPGSNAVAVDAGVKRALAGFADQMPPGITLHKWYDQSELVLAAAGSVRDAILIGIVLAALVLVYFLRSVRVTLVAFLVVPAALAGAILILSLMGLSFNIMTLGGLAASVGLVIDDVIVMIEHIARRAGGDGAHQGAKAVLPAGAEFLRPLGGSSMATLIVFAPLAFLSGVTGAFFKALSVTMAATLAVSWLLTAFAVPLLARGIINFDSWRDPMATHDSRMTRLHSHLLDRLVRRPVLLLFGIVPLLLVGWFAFSHVQTGFIPHLDEGGFVIDYLSKPGTALSETVREVNQMEAILRADPAVATFSRRTGAGLGGDLTEPNEGDFFVRLKPLGQRAPISTVMQRLSDQFTDQVPGIDFDTAQLMSDLIGDLTGVPQPIEIKLSASDPRTLIAAAHRVADAITPIKGVDSVNDGVTLAGDALEIHVDPARAAMVGLNPAVVAQTLSSALDGSVVAQIPGPERQTGVRVWLNPKQRDLTDQLAALPIATPSGALVPLGQIAQFKTVPGQPVINRDNLQQIVAVTARITGRGIGSTIADVKTALAKPGVLGPGISYTLGGLFKQQQIAFAGLTKVFIAAIAAEFLLLLFLYERFMLPLIIIGISLFSTLAVFTGLYVTGVQLNITAIMGMTMIVGIGTEMAIFFASEFSELCHNMTPRDALVAAARNRLRPIAMTTLAAILTLLPLALDIGQGSGMQQPLAIAIISGLLVQFPMVLLALPVLIGLTLPKDA
jgi:multidrug efflux pump subunit AcrB